MGIKPKPPEPVPPVPEPKLPPPPPRPGHITTFDLGQQPELEFAVPFSMKKGEHVILKGKVKKLRVSGLDAGAILDASGLDVSVVTVTGKIDNHSTLKLSAPNGTVQIAGKIDNRSIVEINAPGGEVRFILTTNADRDGSKIDNGSSVTLTARTVEFKGDISGADTKVAVTLTRNAWLKVASVSGKAAVEYKSQMAGWSPPDVFVGPVAATAVFRKVE